MFLIFPARTLGNRSLLLSSTVLRTCPLKRLANHFSAPLRQDDEDLQRRQTRSPAQALGNGDRQTRHLRIFSSTVRSRSCAACRRMSSVSLSSSKAKYLREETAQSCSIHRPHVCAMMCAIDGLAALLGASAPEFQNVLKRLVSANLDGSADARLQRLLVEYGVEAPDFQAQHYLSGAARREIRI